MCPADSINFWSIIINMYIKITFDCNISFCDTHETTMYIFTLCLNHVSLIITCFVAKQAFPNFHLLPTSKLDMKRKKMNQWRQLSQHPTLPAASPMVEKCDIVIALTVTMIHVGLPTVVWERRNRNPVATVCLGVKV